MNTETAKLLHFPEHSKTTAPLLRFSEPLVVFSFPEAISKKQQEIVRRQIEKLVRLGFHNELGLTEEEYCKSFPILLPQPEEYRGRFDIPLIVDPRIPLGRQHELAGIVEYLNTNKISNLSPIPKDSYIIWVHDTHNLEENTVEESISGFGEDEKGCLQVEVTSFYLHHPEFFRSNNRIVSATGSRFNGNLIPCVEFCHDKIRLDAISQYTHFQKTIALSRGERIQQIAA